MNKATGHFLDFILAEKDTGSVIVAEQEAFSAGPALVGIICYEFFPGNSQFGGNELCFYLTQPDLISGTAYPAAEALD